MGKRVKDTEKYRKTVSDGRNNGEKASVAKQQRQQ